MTTPDVQKYLLAQPGAIEHITEYRAALLRRKKGEMSDPDFHAVWQRYSRWYNTLKKLFPEVRKMCGCKQPGVLLRNTVDRLTWRMPLDQEQDIVLVLDTTPDSDDE